MKQFGLIMFGLGALLVGQEECSETDADGDGWTTVDGDCDDSNGDVHPGATEVCDGVDNDCDETIDEALSGSDKACAGSSCLEILESGSSAGDGVYWLQPDSDQSTVQLGLCDMSTAGGGWTLVASNYIGDATFAVGTSREDYYLDMDGYNSDPSIHADYLFGQGISSLEFTEARIYGDRDDDGSILVDISWAQSCWQCYTEVANFSSVTYLEDHNVSSLGCGSAHYCNIDGQYADTWDGQWNSNSNQRTIGGICTQANPDPSSGTYVGHGRDEASYSTEGHYYSGPSGCTYYDYDVNTTWVR